MTVTELLAEIADAPESPLRRLVACDPDADPVTLLLLVHDPDPLVRRALARRPSIPATLWRP